MPRFYLLSLALATLSAGAYAQTPDPAVAGVSTTNNAAPIVRTYAGAPTVTSTQPIGGVWLRADASAAVKTVSADAKGTELRVEHGRANVQVQHPADNSSILVDLPGGQVSLIKDGLYTFNAETNTVRVLRGEAEYYPAANSKPIKVKEEHQLVLAAGAKSKDVDPRDLAADLLPMGPAPGYGGGRYGGGPYGDGYAPAPGYGYYGGYPYAGYDGYGYGYPYAWGYPYGFGLGLGFGYFGGFRGGYYGGYGRFGRR